MRSNEGQYYPGLDQIRGIAALIVYFFHLMHVFIPTSTVPDFFLLSVLEEGHTGVSLFMVLSGYLFSKLLDNKDLVFSKFIWNRALRLCPLLFVIFLYLLIFRDFSFSKILGGLIYSKEWIFATWTLSVEFHFYLLFPILLFLLRKHGLLALICTLIASIALRSVIWLAEGEVHVLAYWTIIGRIDQFVFGMLAFELSKRNFFSYYPKTVFFTGILIFALVWHQFNAAGGFYHLPKFPSTSPIWIILATFEGAIFGVIIASYDQFSNSFHNPISRAFSYLGEISYSLYLWHLVIIHELIRPVVIWIFGIKPTDPWIVAFICIAVLPIFLLVSHLSYTYLEKPFLRFRTKYLYARQPQ